MDSMLKKFLLSAIIVLAVPLPWYICDDAGCEFVFAPAGIAWIGFLWGSLQVILWGLVSFAVYFAIAYLLLTKKRERNNPRDGWWLYGVMAANFVLVLGASFFPHWSQVLPWWRWFTAICAFVFVITGAYVAPERKKKFLWMIALFFIVATSATLMFHDDLDVCLFDVSGCLKGDAFLQEETPQTQAIFPQPSTSQFLQ